MKKLIVFILSALCLCSVFSFAGCADKQNAEEKTFTFYSPDGAPALAVAQFIKDGESFGDGQKFDYNVVSSSDITLYLNGGKGYGDFVVLPVNAASKLYKANKDDPYQMAAVLTHGNLFIISEEEDLTLEKLTGKVIGVIGQGLVPDLTLRAAMFKAGLSDRITVGETATDGKITFRYFAEASNMIPLLKQGKLSYGLLPEPAVSNLEKMASEREWHRADLQQIYGGDRRSYPQAVLMVKSSIVKDYPGVVTAIAEKFAANVEWVENNPADAVDAINANITAKNSGLTPSLNAANITKAVIKGCNVRWQGAADAVAEVKAYINDLLSVSVGLDIAPAKAVEDDFFMSVK